MSVSAVSCFPCFASPGSSQPQQASAMQQPQNDRQLLWVPPTLTRCVSTTACSCLVQELHTAGAQLEEASHSTSGAHLPLRSSPGRAL